MVQLYHSHHLGQENFEFGSAIPEFQDEHGILEDFMNMFMRSNTQGANSQQVNKKIIN
jgi:hypothetical protein